MSDETGAREAETFVGAPEAPVRTRPLTWAVLLGALVVVGLDQWTKQLALERLEAGAATRWFLGELLGWKLVFNPGAALSLGAGSTWVLTILAAVVVVVIVVGARRIVSAPWAVALALILGGAVGNLLDRLFREPSFGHGHVVDFINYAGFFVGNVADIAIVAAAGLVVVLAFRGVPVGAPANEGAPEDASADASNSDSAGTDPADRDDAGPTP